jgi:hypothetical protein
MLHGTVFVELPLENNNCSFIIEINLHGQLLASEMQVRVLVIDEHAPQVLLHVVVVAVHADQVPVDVQQVELFDDIVVVVIRLVAIAVVSVVVGVATVLVPVVVVLIVLVIDSNAVVDDDGMYISTFSIIKVLNFVSDYLNTLAEIDQSAISLIHPTSPMNRRM